MRSVFTILSFLALAAPTLACGVCLSIQGNPLALPHPRAIEVAVATRDALDRKTLRAASASDSGWNERDKTSARKVVLDACERRRSSTDATIHFVVVDTSEAVAVVGRSGRFVVPMQNADAADCVVVTSSHAIKALLDGQLRMDDAIARRLIVVEGRAESLSPLFPDRSPLSSR